MANKGGVDSKMKKKSIYLLSVLIMAMSLTAGGADYEAPANGLTLTSPNGGEVIPSGSLYTIQWEDPLGAVSFNLKYSMDKGGTWKPIDAGVTETSYSWQVPTVPKNKKKCLVKVIGYDDSGNKVGADRSDQTFTIEVVKLTWPDGGEIVKSGGTRIITWTTHETKKLVENVKLLYTKNGGKVWKKIKPNPDPGNPESYEWLVPNVPKTKTKCGVQVVLKDIDGKTVGKDASDGNFTIEPDLFVFAEITGTESPIVAVATDGEDAIGALGERDAGGNPTTITGAVYGSGLGDAGKLEVDMEGLPTSFIDFLEYKAVFENYTESAVDVSVYDPNGDPVLGPTNVDVDPEDLTRIKELYDIANSDLLGGGLSALPECEIHLRDLHILKWASVTLNWTGCLVRPLTEAITSGLPSCFSALLYNIPMLTDGDADDVFMFFLDEGLCGTADLYSCLSILADTAAMEIGGCADIAGGWYASERITVTCTADGETFKETFSGEGPVTINQDECGISWRLDGPETKRKGKINGNKLRFSGKFMTDGGIRFTRNRLTGKGLLCGDEINAKGSGSAAGEIYYAGDWYDFSCKGKSTALFTRLGSVSASEMTEEKEAIQEPSLIFLKNSIRAPCFPDKLGSNGAK